MSKENHGDSWSQKDEQKLKDMLFDGCSYEEMAKELGRSWFACKCRLIKLKLLPFEPQIRRSNVERYDVPLRYVDRLKRNQIENSIDFYIRQGLPLIEVTDCDDTSRTFSDAELNIVVDYFKTRLAKLAVQKLDSKCFQKGLDIARAEEIFISEINKIKTVKTMTIKEREKVLSRVM